MIWSEEFVKVYNEINPTDPSLSDLVGKDGLPLYSLLDHVHLAGKDGLQLNSLLDHVCIISYQVVSQFFQKFFEVSLHDKFWIDKQFAMLFEAFIGFNINVYTCAVQLWFPWPCRVRFLYPLYFVYDIKCHVSLSKYNMCV